MPRTDPPPEDAFSREFRDHLADIRLRIDLLEIVSTAAFRAAVEQNGKFRLDDPRVRRACLDAGLARWLE
jgi:hypothetical protein